MKLVHVELPRPERSAGPSVWRCWSSFSLPPWSPSCADPRGAGTYGDERKTTGANGNPKDGWKLTMFMETVSRAYFWRHSREPHHEAYIVSWCCNSIIKACRNREREREKKNDWNSLQFEAKLSKSWVFQTHLKEKTVRASQEKRSNKL